MIKDSFDPIVKEIRLELEERFSRDVVLSDREMIHLEPDIIVDRVAYIGAESIRFIWKFFSMRAGVQEFQIPASWWQHWKRDHAPNWLKKQWPVKYIKRKADVRWVYPSIPPSINGHNPVLIYREMEGL